MRLTILGVLLALVTSFSALAQDRDGVRSTIDAQIAAFLDDDFELAFSFASPQIRRLFGTSENFGTMVRNGYPMVWRPEQVDYLELTEDSGRTLQKVLIRDQSGQSHILQYEMIPSEKGWLINGVSILRNPGGSV